MPGGTYLVKGLEVPWPDIHSGRNLFFGLAMSKVLVSMDVHDYPQSLSEKALIGGVGLVVRGIEPRVNGKPPQAAKPPIETSNLKEAESMMRVGKTHMLLQLMAHPLGQRSAVYLQARS